MNYTKEQLQAMCNVELSEILCGLLGYEVKQIYAYHQSEMPTVLACTDKPGETAGAWFAVEFGRWDCIMPLAVEHGISINKSNNFVYSKPETLWTASEGVCGGIDFDCDSYGVEFEDENPQRAIACCLILALQEMKK